MWLPIMLLAAPGEDVDASGIYTLFLSDGTPVRATVRVHRLQPIQGQR